MPSDSSYNIGVTDNGDAYTGTKLNGSGHLRVRVDPDCVTVDYVAAWLPQDTLGTNKNREIRHTYKKGARATPTGGGYSINDPFFEVFPNPAGERVTIRTEISRATDRKIELIDTNGKPVCQYILTAGTDETTPSYWRARRGKSDSLRSHCFRTRIRRTSVQEQLLSVS